MKGAINIIFVILFAIIIGIITIVITLGLLGQRPYELGKNLEYTGIIEIGKATFNYEDYIEAAPSFRNEDEIEDYFEKDGCKLLQYCTNQYLKYGKPCQIGVYAIGNYSEGTDINFIRKFASSIARCKFEIAQEIAPGIKQEICYFDTDSIEMLQKYVDANGLYYYNISFKNSSFYSGNDLTTPSLDSTTIIYDITSFPPDNICSPVAGRYKIAILNVTSKDLNCNLLIAIAYLPYLANELPTDFKSASTPLKVFDVIRNINFRPIFNQRTWDAIPHVVGASQVNNQGAKDCKDSPFKPCCSLDSGIIYHCDFGDFSRYCFNTTDCLNYIILTPITIKINENSVNITDILRAVRFGLYANPTYRKYEIPYRDFKNILVPPYVGTIWNNDYSSQLSDFEGRYIYYNTNEGKEKCFGNLDIQVGYAIRQKNNKEYLLPIISIRCWKEA
ncbi:MAG: hypothetical protein QXO19_01290 [Candidatus Aenigmatarchaeota archaeon]